MDLLDRFLDELADSCRPLTISTYRSRLAGYVTKLDPLTVTADELGAWFAAEVRARKLKPATAQTYLGAIRSLHRWMHDVAKLRDDNPALPLKTKRPEPRIAQPPSSARIVQLLAELGARDAAACAIMYGGALRVGETLSLRLVDVDADARRVHVRDGKGGSQLLVPIPTGAADRLQRWLDAHPGDTPWLFPSHEGSTGRLTRMAMGDAIHAAAIRLGWDPTPWHPHAFRHACATELMRRDVQLRKIQRLLRHTNSRQTEQYTHVVVDDLAAAIDEHHPLSLSAEPPTIAGTSTRPGRVRIAWAS